MSGKPQPPAWNTRPACTCDQPYVVHVQWMTPQGYWRRQVCELCLRPWRR